MKEEELKAKLKELQKIKPDLAWLKSSRSFILAKIKEVPQEQPSLKFSFSFGYKLAFIFSLFLLLCSGFLIIASSASLKSPFYPLRLALEKSLIALAPQSLKMDLKLALAKKTIKEYNELFNGQKADLALKNFDQNLKEISADLKKIPHPQELLSLTQRIQKEIREVPIEKKELFEPLNNFQSQIFALEKEAEEKIVQCPNYLFEKLNNLNKALESSSLKEEKAQIIVEQLKEAQDYLNNYRCVDALVILDKLTQELGL